MRLADHSAEMLGLVSVQVNEGVEVDSVPNRELVNNLDITHGA